ncbi:peptidylprolyl isomerase [Stratiformator vulcanicus]|uniref:Foldase protein PrsA 1 n=1 Tax=Stratiformator vulcanicus TaxID=2527980 RepID=A0A517R0T2_9PLAN|nr:peptidylprolyl isomerase [Stratiformator vulcanicus]QDT37440.1 Foldase protein PrsA 1 precursor [Stratiformator vulcanicus]
MAQRLLGWLVVIAVGLPAPFTRAAEEPVALVNGEPITAADITFERSLRKVAGSDADVPRALIVEELISRELLRQFLKDRRAIPEVEQIDRAKTRFIERLTAGRPEARAQLEQLGLTDARLETAVAVSLGWETHLRRVITEKSLRDYFEANRRRFDGSRLKVRQIFLAKGFDGVPPAQTQMRLEQIRQEINGDGDSFAAAALKHSEAPSSAEGGSLGWISPFGDIPSAIAPAVFRLGAGEISEPLESPLGWHLVLVEQIEEGELSLEDVRPIVRAELARQLRSQLVAEQRRSAQIERN